MAIVVLTDYVLSVPLLRKRGGRTSPVWFLGSAAVVARRLRCCAENSGMCRLRKASPELLLRPALTRPARPTRPLRRNWLFIVVYNGRKKSSCFLETESSFKGLWGGRLFTYTEGRTAPVNGGRLDLEAGELRNHHPPFPPVWRGGR